MHLNQEVVDWQTVDIDYLRDALQYEINYMKMVENASLASSIKKALQQVKSRNVKLEYSSQAHFSVLAKQLHLMEDEKAGVPRTAYKGIVETRPSGNHFLFLVPTKQQAQVERKVILA